MTGNLRIGYLPLYVSYYESVRPQFLVEKTAVARRCADVLSGYGEVIWDGTLIADLETAHAAGVRLANEAPDCLVVLPTIAVFGAIPWAAIRHNTAPVMIWNAQQIETVRPGYDMVEIVRNTGQIGTQALANTLLREGRWFRVVAAWEEGAATAKQLSRWFAVLRAVKTLRGARLLSIGEPFPLMTDILLDECALKEWLGASVMRISEAELVREYEAVSQDRVEAHKNACRDRIEWEAITPDEFDRSVRLSEAVSTLVTKSDTAGGTLNCHGVCLRNSSIGVTACYSLGVQNRHGRPFTCTGDLPTALALLALKTLTGAAMYTEVQVMDEARRAIVIANSGEGEDGVCRKGSVVRVRGNTNFSGLHGRGASFAYPLEPGPATIVSFTPAPGGWRLIAAEGEILEEAMPDVGALTGFFRFRNGDLHTCYRRWLEAGAVHHAATTLGHWSGELETLSDLLGMQFLGV
jgi:L-arabinose isomerase